MSGRGPHGCRTTKIGSLRLISGPVPVYDVAVIGGGVVGCAVLHELSRYHFDLVLLEKQRDLAEGITKANSGVIHAGFNVPCGSLKARTNVAGLRTIYGLASALGVAAKKTGKLVIGLTDGDRRTLEALKAEGDRNGSPELTIVGENEIRAIEPLARGRWALFSPHSGIISPYELTIALAERAWRGGARIELESPLVRVTRGNGTFRLTTPNGELFARWVVNSAGLYADRIAGLAGTEGRRIYPCRGEYLITDRDCGIPLRLPVYPVPSRDNPGLGIHITPTLEGNILLGPSAEFIEDRENIATTRAVMDRLKAEAAELLPEVEGIRFIHSYSGLRPKLVGPSDQAKFADFVIEESLARPGWINILGIESPGLTAAPAIAEMVAQLIGVKEDLRLRKDRPRDQPVSSRFAHLGDRLRAAMAAGNPDGGEMVCRCEHVTRAEVVAAIRSPFRARTLDAVKRRTRCGMGRCQGGFCTPRIVEILQEEGVPLENITKRGEGSWLFSGRNKAEPKIISAVADSRSSISPKSSGRFPPIGKKASPQEDLEIRSSSGVSVEALPVEDHEVVVIGGGPAGLAAALGARRAGAEDVLIVERETSLGGILNQCIHDGFGLFLYNESLSGPEYAERLAEEAGREDVRSETGSMALDLSSDRILRISSRGGYRLVRAKAVVLAMGCRERTREMIEIPGTRPAGIFTAGSAQNLVNLQNVRIGNRAVILGSGDVGLIMARRLVFEGIDVEGVFEILPWASGLERNIRQCLLDFGIPLELSATVVEIKGRDRVESVVIARVDDALKPVPGTEFGVPCDTLLLSVGLIPENELAGKAGVELSPDTGGAFVDETMMTSVPGIFSCGNVLHIHDVADWASFEGFKAGESAARFADGKISAGEKVRILAGTKVRYCLPHFVRPGSKGVEIAFRATCPVRGQTVLVKGKGSGTILFHQKFSRLVPSELQRIRLKGTVDEDLEVSCLD